LPREPDNGNESATKRERLLLPARQLSAVIRAVRRESVVDNPYYEKASSITRTIKSI
jgi:hypothetical protein